MTNTQTEKQEGIVAAIDQLVSELTYRRLIAADKAAEGTTYNDYDELDATMEVRRAIARYEEATNA